VIITDVREEGSLLIVEGTIGRGHGPFKAYADNVIIVMDPRPTETASGIALVNMRGPGAKEHRTARVIASGPGYHTRLGFLIPNEVKEGDRVLVDAFAGQNYAMDLTVPRHNKSPQFEELFGERGEFRIVRHDEILAVLEDEAQAAE
jgi:co-chaperonin GroES (HSP10)